MDVQAKGGSWIIDFVVFLVLSVSGTVQKYVAC